MMNALMKFNQPLTMSSREIAELCGKEHRNVKRDIAIMCQQLKIDALKFEHIYFDSMNRQQTEYRLDKDNCLCLITGYNAKLRMAIIQRWQELENQQPKLPQTLPEALRLAADLAEQNQIQAQQIAQDRPKVLFAEAVTASETCILVGELAKLIKQNGVDIGQNRLFQWLRENGFLTKSNEPTQRAMDLTNRA